MSTVSSGTFNLALFQLAIYRRNRVMDITELIAP